MKYHSNELFDLDFLDVQDNLPDLTFSSYGH
jgi:hypothetical protein